LAQTGKVADRYMAVWNEPDAERRRQAVAALWTEDGTYTDPLAAVEGHEAIARELENPPTLKVKSQSRDRDRAFYGTPSPLSPLSPLLGHPLLVDFYTRELVLSPRVER